MKNKIKITVVGSGYVGMSLAVLLSQHNDVIVLDINSDRVKSINNKILHIPALLIIKLEISFNPCPFFKLLKINGFFPRILRVSLSIISKLAPTIGAKAITIIL